MNNTTTITRETLTTGDLTREDLQRLIKTLEPAKGIGRINRLIDAAQAKLNTAA